MKTIKTTIHHYRFDISKPEDKAAHDALLAELAATPGRGHWLHVLADTSRPDKTWPPMFADNEAEDIELETYHLFENQWNATNGWRVFDHYEAIFPNKNIKSGHYLDITPEMIEIRNDTLTCGYCGKHYRKHSAPGAFCRDCLDSPHLKPDALHLLRLQPVSTPSHLKRPLLSDAERAEIEPLYLAAQTKINAEKMDEQRRKVEARYEKETEAARTEHDGFIWLLDHGINIENCIFYSHRGVFSFGWQTPLAANVAAELETRVEGFPFPFEIKRA